MTIGDIVILAFLVYTTVGVLFAIAFVTLGVQRIDPAAEGTPLLFRLLITPGSAAFWPTLALRWLRSPHHGTKDDA